MKAIPSQEFKWLSNDEALELFTDLTKLRLFIDHGAELKDYQALDAKLNCGESK